MKAIVLTEHKNPDSLQIQEVEKPSPGPGEAVVRVKACALNHRDVWIAQGLYAGIKVPIILGSDGAGVVDEVGSKVDKSWNGKSVVINPGLNWGADQRFQQQGYEILGLPHNGTQAEYVCVPASNLVEKPDYLSFEEAAAIPLAGLTGYRALFYHGQLKSEQTVLLTGIGGGVAALMLQMAVAASARVLVTSGTEEKITRAVSAGAVGGANYRSGDWPGRIRGLSGASGIDLIVDSSGGAGFDDLINIAKPGASIVVLGATAGNPDQLNLCRVFWKQLTIQGTTMGSEQDFQEMINFFGVHKLRPLIHGPFPFSDYKRAYASMISGEQFGKIVISVEV